MGLFLERYLFFIGCNKVAQETGSELDPKKQSHSAVRHSNDPVLRTTSKWPTTSSLILADSFFVFCQVYDLVSVLLRFCCCFLYQET